MVSISWMTPQKKLKYGICIEQPTRIRNASSKILLQRSGIV